MIISMDFLLLVLIAAVFSAGTIWLIVFGNRHRLSSLPVHERHRKAEPTQLSHLGGLGILAGFLVGMTAFAWMVDTGESLSTWAVALISSGLMFVLGFTDDLHPLSAKVKLAGQLGIACLAYSLGLQIDLLTGFGGSSIPLQEPFCFLLTLGWLVALPNILNLVDGIDGLAGGLGIFVAVTLGIVTFGSDQALTAGLCFIFAGALFGFLLFNYPPAKIYMGDSGAYLIGSFIANISLQSSQKGSVGAIFLVVIIALGLPILDTAFAITRRGLRGMPLFRGDAEHIHHRLLDRGHSKRTVITMIYGISLTLSTAGLVVFWTQGLASPIVATLLFGGALLFGAIDRAEHFLDPSEGASEASRPGATRNETGSSAQRLPAERTGALCVTRGILASLRPIGTPSGLYLPEPRPSAF